MKNEETVFAVVEGEALRVLPKDLFIPPDALQVFLDNFEGPLDLLLYLIKKQKLDIVNLPLLQITEQYMRYIALMEELQFDLAAEYLVMAATLAEIKSRLLLPRNVVEEENEEDPRVLLIQQLQAYEVIKKGAEVLDELPRIGRDFWRATVHKNDELKPVIVPPSLDFERLISSLNKLLNQHKLYQSHKVEKEMLSTKEKKIFILSQLRGENFHLLSDFFVFNEGRIGIVVTFLSILELMKELCIEIQQMSLDSAIYIRNYRKVE